MVGNPALQGADATTHGREVASGHRSARCGVASPVEEIAVKALRKTAGGAWTALLMNNKQQKRRDWQDADQEA
jgi:hypothetical protein